MIQLGYQKKGTTLESRSKLQYSYQTTSCFHVACSCSRACRFSRVRKEQAAKPLDNNDCILFLRHGLKCKDSEVVGDATDTAEHEDATVDAGSSPEVLPGDMQTWVSGDSVTRSAIHYTPSGDLSLK